MSTHTHTHTHTHRRTGQTAVDQALSNSTAEHYSHIFNTILEEEENQGEWMEEEEEEEEGCCLLTIHAPMFGFFLHSVGTFHVVRCVVKITFGALISATLTLYTPSQLS